MPVLRNARWELFAQHVATGKKYAAAFSAAGYEGDPKIQARRLAMRPEVIARIREIQAKMVEKKVETVVYSRDDVLKGLWENYRRAMQAEPVLDAQGNETGTFKYNGQVANRSLELLGYELGMFPRTANIRHSSEGDLDGMGPEALIRYIERVFEEIGWKVDTSLLREAIAHGTSIGPELLAKAGELARPPALSAALHLPAVHEAARVSRDGADEEGAPLHGWEPDREDDLRGGGDGDARDGSLP